MKKIIAFGASNSRQSINQQLARWAAAQVETARVNMLDLNDYEMPIYGIDRERQGGIPEAALQIKDSIKEADGIIISLAEHNGGFTAAFKNIIDWVSRIEREVWANKPMFLMAASPGPRGGKGVLNDAIGGFPHQGAQVVASFSLPSFNQNFDPEEGISEPELRQEFEDQLASFTAVLDKTPAATPAT